MPTTPMRALRVSDDIWDNAKIVAEVNDTTVTAMIVLFLKKLHPDRRPYSTAKNVARTVAGPRKTPQHFKATVFAKGHKPAKQQVDKGTCMHGSVKTIPYGTFCLLCGTRMA